MRILHLISSGGFFGAEKVLLSLVECLRAKGHEVTIAALEDKRTPHLEILERAKKLNIPTASFISHGRFDANTIIAIKDHLMENQFECLHTHNYKSNLLGLLASKDLKIKRIATAHGYTGASLAVKIYEAIDRKVLNSFTKVIVVSPSVVANQLKSNMSVIPNGLNLQTMTMDATLRLSARKRLGFKENDFVWGSVGRLSPEKNQMLLLKAFEELKVQYPHIRLLIVGDGPDKDSLQRFVSEKKLSDGVVFTGLVTEVGAMYQAMDAFVLPSRTEGIPMSLLEAMAYRLPVVATKVGGIPQIIHLKETGVLVESEDIKGLVDAVEDVMENVVFRNTLIEKAAELVKEEYSLEKMCKAYERVYIDG